MKKFGKFLFGAFSIATVAVGTYYVYKNYIKNDTSDDFDEFDDDFEDFDTDDEVEKEPREYVSINLESNEKNKDTKEAPSKAKANGTE
jgi:hypothetical protein